MTTLFESGALRREFIERSSIYAGEVVKNLVERHDVRYCSLW